MKSAGKPRGSKKRSNSIEVDDTVPKKPVLLPTEAPVDLIPQVVSTEVPQLSKKVVSNEIVPFASVASVDPINEAPVILNVPSSLKCGICIEILKEPVQCQKGHCFCRSCINAWIDEEKNDCPVCRTVIAGSICDVASFIREQIGLVRLKCKNDGCNVIEVSSDLMSHMTCCPFRLITCPVCHVQVVASDVEKHLVITHNTTSVVEGLSRLLDNQRQLIDRYKNGRSLQLKLNLPNGFEDGGFPLAVGGVNVKFYLSGEHFVMGSLKSNGENIKIRVTAEVKLGKSTFTFNACCLSSSGFILLGSGNTRSWVHKSFIGTLNGEKLKPKDVKSIDILMTWQYYGEQ